jgi:hypothetical protein
MSANQTLLESVLWLGLAFVLLFPTTANLLAHKWEKKCILIGLPEGVPKAN